MCYNIWLDTILQSSQICLLCLIIPTGLLPLGAALGPLLSSSAFILALLCVLPLSVCICWATTRPLQETWVVKNSHLPTTPNPRASTPPSDAQIQPHYFTNSSCPVPGCPSHLSPHVQSGLLSLTVTWPAGTPVELSLPPSGHRNPVALSSMFSFLFCSSCKGLAVFPGSEKT